jgi:hypothetical protein
VRKVNHLKQCGKAVSNRPQQRSAMRSMTHCVGPGPIGKTPKLKNAQGLRYSGGVCIFIEQDPGSMDVWYGGGAPPLMFNVRSRHQADKYIIYVI